MSITAKELAKKLGLSEAAISMTTNLVSALRQENESLRQPRNTGMIFHAYSLSKIPNQIVESFIWLYSINMEP